MLLLPSPPPTTYIQTLMHFAVEGAQRVVVMNHRGDEQVVRALLTARLFQWCCIYTCTNL